MTVNNIFIRTRNASGITRIQLTEPRRFTPAKMQLKTFLFACFSIASAAIVPDGGFLRAQSKCSKTVQWSPERKAKVIGGQVPPVGAVPWQVTLRNNNNKHQCGGALISEKLVLSAAHCYMEELSAVAGAHGPPGEFLISMEHF